jgi:hypothetical protein
MATDTKNASAANVKAPGETAEVAYLIPCNQIDWDWDWNSRSRPTLLNATTGKRMLPTASPDQDKAGETGFAGTYESIKLKGQVDPGTVRPHPDPKKRAKTPYMAVAGFSRGEAIMMIADELGNKSPVFKTFVKEMTEAQAREENLRENNGGRTKLSAPDLLFGIQRLRAEDSSLTGVAIAQKIGMSQGYASRMCAIADKAKSPTILAAWRSSKVAIPYAAIETIVSKNDTAEAQDKAYAALTAAKPSATTATNVNGNGDNGPSASGRDSWAKVAGDKALVIGRALGIAHKAGGLLVSDKKTFFRDYLDTFVDIKVEPAKVTALKAGDTPEAQAKRLTEAQEKHAELVLGIVARFKEGFQHGLKGDAVKAEEVATN